MSFNLDYASISLSYPIEDEADLRVSDPGTPVLLGDGRIGHVVETHIPSHPMGIALYTGERIIYNLADVLPAFEIEVRG